MIFRPLILAACLALLLLSAGPAGAVYVEERLADPAAEARAVALSKKLRCLVCQNQTISDSDAGLARDLRQLVRERITAGDSDAMVLQYMVDRYGDWILMEPPFKLSTLMLWGAPALFLFGGALMLIVLVRRRRNDNAPVHGQALSAAEKERLEALLKPAQEDKS